MSQGFGISLSMEYAPYIIVLLYISIAASAFSSRYQKLFKLIATLAALPIIYTLVAYVVIYVVFGVFLEGLEALRSLLIPLVSVISIGATLAWYWAGRYQHRERVVLGLCLAVMAAVFTTHPVMACRGAYAFEVPWAARCLSEHYRQESHQNPVKALEFRKQAALWGDADIAFYLSQTSGADMKDFWLSLAAKRGQLDARYKQFHPMPNAPIQDMEQMAALAEEGQVDAQYHYGYWLLTQTRRENGLSMMRQSANAGSVRAQRFLALEYLGTGIAVERDLEASQHWFDRQRHLSRTLKEARNAEGNYFSAYLPEHYQQPWADVYRQGSERASAAFNGNPSAQLRVGERLMWFDEPAIMERGLGWLKRALKNDSVEAAKSLSRYYRKAMKDDPKLTEDYLHYLEQTAQLGDGDAAFTLAGIYAEGKHGEPINVKKAQSYSRLAASRARTNSWTQTSAATLAQNLSLTLDNAEEYGADKSELEARAATGDAAAMYFLSEMLNEPVYKTQHSSERSVALMRRSAELGYPPAQMRKGMSLNRGWDDPAKKKLGFKWLKEAAEKGDAGAMYELGWFYSRTNMNHPRHRYSPYRAKYWMTRAIAVAEANKQQLYQDKNGVYWLYFHRNGRSGTGQTLPGAREAIERFWPSVLSRLDLSDSSQPVADIKEWYYREIDRVLAEGEGDLDTLNKLYNAMLKDPAAAELHY